jgi:4-carboxymuconolactone decarboxylase
MRIQALAREQMNAAQQSAWDEAVGGRRGAPPVPLTAWIHSPPIAAHAQRLGEALRFDTVLPSRGVALAALMIAARWRAPHIWRAQEAKLRDAGMSEAAITAVAQNETPALENAHDRVVHATIRMLLDYHSLDDATHAAALDASGKRGLVELVAVAGYYTMVAMTLKAFEMDEGASMPG